MNLWKKNETGKDLFLQDAEQATAQSLLNGNTQKETGKKFGVEHSTIKNKVQSIYDSIEAVTEKRPNLVEALLYLLLHNVISLPITEKKKRE